MVGSIVGIVGVIGGGAIAITYSIYPVFQLVFLLIGLIVGVITLPIFPIGFLVGYLGSWWLSAGVMFVVTGITLYFFTLLGFGVIWIPIDIIFSPMISYMLFSPISASLDLINILKVSINSILNLLALE